ncbi:MAG: DUF1939 domain-containing protein, partial [Planctomycetes bacterium]|nr:DUF1939 domain-containing protein [Planctomycetota bacterium]
MKYRARACLLGLGLALAAAPGHAGVLFQDFYWETVTPPGKGSWWQHAAETVPALRDAGVTALWVPSPGKGSSGGYSMGYDPYDYYDLGSKDQRGSVATRFGRKEEFLAMVAMAHAWGLHVYPDLVPNHRAGGAGGGYVYDSLVGSEALGRFPMGHGDFHHNGYTDFDMDMGGGRDIAHEVPYVRDQFFRWMRWFDKQTGVDGYRLDATKHMDSNFIEGLLYQVQEGMGQSRFAVGEYFDANLGTLQWWVNAVHRRSSTFDFALKFRLHDMAHGNGYFDMRGLDYHFRDYEKSVTFLNSHDTANRGNGMHTWVRANLAYAYMLAAPGYPCVYYSDFYDHNGVPRDYLANLMWVNTFLAHGDRMVRWADDDLFVMERRGNLLAGLNDNTLAWRDEWVQTDFGPHVQLHDYANGVADRWTDSNGWVQLSVPPSGYVMYGRMGLGGQRPDPRPYRTAQEWEGNYDMDWKAAGEWWGEPVRIAAQQGEPLVADCWLEDRSLALRIALFDQDGRLLHAERGVGHVYMEYLNPPRSGWYQVRLGLERTGQGHRSPAWLKLEYMGPRSWPGALPALGNSDPNVPSLDPPAPAPAPTSTAAPTPAPAPAPTASPTPTATPTPTP